MRLWLRSLPEWWKEKNLKKERIAHHPNHTALWRRQRYNIDIATSGTGSLVFIADVTANISSRIILKYTTLYSQLRLSQMLQNWLDRAPQCKWIMTRSKLQEKSSCKSSEKPFKVKLKVWTLITDWLCDPVWWCAEAKLQIFCLSPNKYWT